MSAKTNIGLSENLLFPDAENADDLKELILAISSLHELVSYRTGDIAIPASEYLEHKVSSTIHSQDYDKVYSKTLDSAQLGDFVTFQTSGDCLKATTKAHGFVSEILDPVTGIVAVSLTGLADFYTGLVIGTEYYLTSGGGITSVSGIHRLGFAVSTTGLYVNIN